MLSDINISHGSVATPLRCGGICNDGFIENFLLSVTVIIWQSYGQEFGVLFFYGPRCSLLTTCFSYGEIVTFIFLLLARYVPNVA